MKIKDIIKKQTTIIAIAVILVTITVIGISYAIFFDVKTNSKDQVITAGTLKLTVADVNALTLKEPMSTADGVSYTVRNTDSNLPATYSLYVYAGSGNNIPLSSIKISTDGNATSGSTSKTLTSIQETIVEGGTTYYRIDTGNLNAGASGTTKYIRIWIDEELVADEISNGKLNLQLYVVSEVQE